MHVIHSQVLAARKSCPFLFAPGWAFAQGKRGPKSGAGGVEDFWGLCELPGG
jgi:hypothetical protein